MVRKDTEMPLMGEGGGRTLEYPTYHLPEGFKWRKSALKSKNLMLID